MIKPIVRDVLFLSLPSEPAAPADTAVGCDLQDTLAAHAHECVGMAANMIGIRKRVIIANIGILNLVMYNPVIVKKSGEYQTEEGCLSLTGKRACTRYRNITVEYRDAGWKKHRQDFSGWPAQIVQHEADHLEGIII